MFIFLTIPQISRMSHKILKFLLISSLKPPYPVLSSLWQKFLFFQRNKVQFSFFIAFIFFFIFLCLNLFILFQSIWMAPNLIATSTVAAGAILFILVSECTPNSLLLSNSRNFFKIIYIFLCNSSEITLQFLNNYPAIPQQLPWNSLAFLQFNSFAMPF